MILPAGDLVAHGDIVFGQLLEAPVVVHVLGDLGDLVLGHALGKLLTLEETLENVIRAAGGGLARGVGFEELPAQGAAPEPVNGLHLLEEVLPLLLERVEVRLHGHNVSV